MKGKHRRRRASWISSQPHRWPMPQPGVCQARNELTLQTCEAWTEQCLEHTAPRVLAPLAKLACIGQAAVAGRAEAAASAADATCMLLKLATQRANYPIAAACTTAHHQGTEPQKEACLIHRRHARRAPAPDVLIERRCRVESLIKRSDRGNVPAADVVVEGGCSIE